MKLNRELLKKHERMANKYRYSKTSRVKSSNDIQVSRAQHPSQTRSPNRQSSVMDKRNSR